MKKEYFSPEVEIEEFYLTSEAMITTSGFEDVDTEEDW